MDIRRLQRPVDPGGPGYDLFELDARLWDVVLLETVGDDDLGSSALRRWSWSDPNPHTRYEYLGAVEGTRLVGVAFLELPQADNQHVAYLSIAVRPESRRKGIGGALLDAAVALGRELGRTSFQAWTWEAYRQPGTGGLQARDGDGVIDRDSPRAAFLLNRGFRLAQVDLMSRLTIPDRNRLLDLSGAARQAVGDEYEFECWSGPTPPEHLADLATLMTAMSTDIPVGEADLQAEAYDAARVRGNDARVILGGLEQFITAARHRPSGQLVGFTRLIHDGARAEVGDQWETLVVGAHRGHGLGYAMKVRNLIALSDARPAARRVVTGNASENGHMLAINTRLGFTPFAASGWFERREAAGGAQ